MSRMSKKIALALAFVVFAGGVAARAQAPKEGVYISADDVKAVLQHSIDTKRTIPDNTIEVLDMGSYQLSVAVVHRGPTGGARPANANPPARPASATPVTPCGEKQPGATGPNGILHDDTSETYYVTSGGGTLVMGGTIVNGRRSRPDDEVTTILNGPSCIGTMVGFTTRELKEGDIVVIPEGVPHGFLAVPDHITYVSFRPDPKKVLQHGYVNPALKN